MNRSRIATPLLGLALITVSGAAAAHTGHEHGIAGFMSGLAHPFGGLDHLLAMVTVGLWSAAAFPVGRRALAPAVFVIALAAGALVAHAAPVAAGAAPLETLIAGSVLLLGLLLALARRLPLAAGLAITTAAGLMHGLAHGLEAAGDVSFTAYVIGFVMASASLHAVGLVTGGALLDGRARAWRVIGALVGLAGAAMLLARI